MATRGDLAPSSLTRLRDATRSSTFLWRGPCLFFFFSFLLLSFTFFYLSSSVPHFSSFFSLSLFISNPHASTTAALITLATSHRNDRDRRAGSTPQKGERSSGKGVVASSVLFLPRSSVSLKPTLALRQKSQEEKAQRLSAVLDHAQLFLQHHRRCRCARCAGSVALACFCPCQHFYSPYRTL